MITNNPFNSGDKVTINYNFGLIPDGVKEIISEDDSVFSLIMNVALVDTKPDNVYIVMDESELSNSESVSGYPYLTIFRDDEGHIVEIPHQLLDKVVYH